MIRSYVIFPNSIRWRTFADKCNGFPHSNANTKFKLTTQLLSEHKKKIRLLFYDRIHVQNFGPNCKVESSCVFKSLKMLLLFDRHQYDDVSRQTVEHQLNAPLLPIVFAIDGFSPQSKDFAIQRHMCASECAARLYTMATHRERLNVA